MWWSLYELLANFYGYDLDYCRYRLTFAQALTLIELNNEREMRKNEAMNEPKKDADFYEVGSEEDPESLPAMEDILGVFSRQ